MSRVFKNKDSQITQKYKKGTHNGIDLVGYKNALDYIIAHSDGEVVGVRSNYKTTDKTGNSYGNYVKIKHSNRYYTLYAHLKYGSVTVQKGDKVEKGQVIGYMGATGHCTGAHLHFEVRETYDIQVDPTPYINADLPKTEETTTEPIEEVVYVVKKGDTLSGIASKYGTTYQKLAEYNNIENPNLIYAGQKIVIPTTDSSGSITYTVQSGDNLSKIAKKYNTTWQKIYEDNKDVIGNDPNLIKVGQVLNIN